MLVFQKVKLSSKPVTNRGFDGTSVFDRLGYSPRARRMSFAQLQMYILETRRERYQLVILPLLGMTGLHIKVCRIESQICNSSTESKLENGGSRNKESY